MFSFNFDIGWGIVAIVLGIFGFGLYLFIGFNIIAYDIAQRQGRLPKPNVVVLPVSGIIRYNVRPGSGFQKLVRQIEWIRKNKPKAVILRINSPGGSTGATHELYESLKSLRDEGIRVVAHMEDLAASGGVYVAMAAEKIVATPGTLTGSIGVIVPHFDFSEMLKRIGVKSDNVKAGEYKDMMSMSKPSEEKAKEIMQLAVNEVQTFFVVLSRKAAD